MYEAFIPIIVPDSDSNTLFNYSHSSYTGGDICGHNEKKGNGRFKQTQLMKNNNNKKFDFQYFIFL